MSWKEHRRANLSAQAILNILEEEGADASSCLRGTDLKPSDILNVDTKISDEMEIKILVQALELLPNKAGYGVRVGQSLRVTTFGIWGLAIMTSADLRTAFETMNRFTQLSVTLSKVQLVEQGDKAHFVVMMDELPTSLHRFMFERYYATAAIFMREMMPDLDLSRFELHLRRVSSDYVRELHQITGRTIVHDQSEYAVVVDGDLLDRPLPQADPLTHAHFVGQCQAILRKYQDLPNYAQMVRDYMLQNNLYAPRLEDVAKHYGVSARTLRRRLETEKTSFSDVVLGTKMALAKELLSTAGLPVNIVAARLNYAESASFTRAFTQWWGAPPSKINATDLSK